MAFVIVFPNSDLQRSKHYLFYRRYNVDYNLASHETLPQQLSLSHTHTKTHNAKKINFTATTESHTQLGSAWRYARVRLPMKPDDSEIKEQETSSRAVGRSQKKGGEKRGESSDVPLAQFVM